MSYLNQVIKRTAPMTRCQCAVLAVLNEAWASNDEIWKRGPRYCENKYGHMRGVGYGTIRSVLLSLVQQGFAERSGGKRPKYRSVKL